MFADYHVHTSFSSDSDAPCEQMIEKAIRLGMDRICITDHYDMDYETGEFQLDTPAYEQKILELQELYADRIEVLYGVEMGLKPDLEENRRFSGYLESHPFDYCIGSVHVIDGKDPYYRDEFAMSDAEMFRRYFEITLENIRALSGFQTLGHLDYAVRYGIRKAEEYSYRRYSDLIDMILIELINRGIALEVNTAGYRAGLGAPNPHPDVIRRYHNLGGERIVLGSDAHAPEYLGYGMDMARDLLLSLGIRYVTVYKKKKPEMIRL